MADSSDFVGKKAIGWDFVCGQTLPQTNLLQQDSSELLDGSGDSAVMSNAQQFSVAVSPLPKTFVMNEPFLPPFMPQWYTYAMRGIGHFNSVGVEFQFSLDSVQLPELYAAITDTGTNPVPITSITTTPNDSTALPVLTHGYTCGDSTGLPGTVRTVRLLFNTPIGGPVLSIGFRVPVDDGGTRTGSILSIKWLYEGLVPGEQLQFQEIKFDDGTREFRKLIDNSVVPEVDIDLNTLTVGKCPEVAPDQVVTFEKFVTNTTTGLITEVIQETNLTTGAVSYFTNAGLPYTLIAGDVVADYPIRVVLADALPITATNLADAVLSVPANAAHAEIHVFDNAIIYTVDGSTPDASAGNGIRVNVGGTFELEGADELNKFKARALSATNAKIDVAFNNIPTPAE